MLAGTDSGLLVPLLIALFGSTGLIGAILTTAKFRGEKDSAAVSQAQGANETLHAVNQALQEQIAVIERERDYWRRLYRDCERARKTSTERRTR